MVKITMENDYLYSNWGWKPKMSQTEFIKKIAIPSIKDGSVRKVSYFPARAKIKTELDLNKLGFFALPCHCNSPHCPGWNVVGIPMLDIHVKNFIPNNPNIGGAELRGNMTAPRGYSATETLPEFWDEDND